MADVADAPAGPVVGDRGELALLLDGAQLGLRPTFEAIDAIEASTGQGLIDLARMALAGKMSLSVTSQIAAECIRAWGRETGDKGAAGANARRIANLILDSEGGFHAALQTVAAMLSLATTGGYNSSGEMKPSTTMTTTTTEKAPVDG
ncbi:GTA-gp10 family protein [Sphingomonas sp. BAUL-RG-20F-R05-02]|uniref:GTA-gp10 family protein n=1 Tax=Sphingomonas sp. BAUL-RG-20F-R05-02 TaxID=2914830 RepID=UPI001F575D17|nr:GTA-gp10 family protein [Sphingomonas sp. BAUL-RG-20F-R05-02]